MNPIAPQEWIARCAQRIVQVDQNIADDEAHRIANDMREFERTAAMEPEAAVDFVASSLGNLEHRFERRSVPRS
jgi:hypothetical protein